MLKGYFYISLTITCWILSNFVITHIQKELHFNNTLLIAFAGSIPSFSLWALYFNKTPHYLRDYLRKAIPMSIIALASNVSYNSSLGYNMTSLTVIMSSSSTIFTLLFEVWLLKERFQVTTAFGSLLSFFGCVMVAIGKTDEGEKLLADTTHSDKLACIGLSLFSAVSSGLFSVLVNVYKIEDSAFFLPCMGSATLAMSPVVLLVSHYLNLQQFDNMTMIIFGFVLLNGFLGVIANYFNMRSLTMLSPVVVNVFLSLQIPVNILIDWLVRPESQQPSHLFVLGSVVVFGSALIVAAAPPRKREEGQDIFGETESEGLSVRLRSLEDEDLLRAE